MQDIKYFWIWEVEVSKSAKVAFDLKYLPFFKVVP